MPRLVCKTLLPVLLALSLSCGDDADSVSSFAAAYCGLIKPCCAMAKLGTDGQLCQFVFVAAGGQSSYNKQAGEACLAETRAAASKPDFCQSIESDEPSACDNLFGSPGKKQPGEACTEDQDCAPSSEGSVQCQSSFATGAQVGQCLVVVKGKDGDKPCVGTRDGNSTFSNIGDDIPAKGYLCHVADGLRCNATTDTCVKLKVIGEACAGDDECVRTGFCESAQRKCTERKPIGGACTPSFNNQECVAGAWCSDVRMACAAQVDNGGACTEGEECKSDNCVDDKCGPGLGDLGLALLCGGN